MMAAFEKFGGPQFISQYELLQNDGKPLTLQWQVMVDGPNGREKMRIIPDQYFGFGREEGERLRFFLEADTGTMPVVRSSAKQSSLLQEIQIYMATLKDNDFKATFGIPTFTVILIVPSEERAKHLQEVILEQAEPVAGMFLIAINAQLLGQDPYAFSFLSGRGGRVVIWR